MNQIHGTHVAPADNLTYEYDATWNEHPAGLLWSATILREQKTIAQPSGVITGVTVDHDVESFLPHAIHKAIERLGRAA